MQSSTKSFWMEETVLFKKYPTLENEIESDVVIVGGGLAGVTTAYLLAKNGKKVVLLERNSIGSGMTSRTTAFITHVVDTELQTLIKQFGEEQAKMIWQSNQDAIDLIEQIVVEEKIDCNFMRCPAYIFSLDEKGADLLQQEQESAHKLGFYHVHFLRNNYLPFKNEGYLLAERQAKFQPLQYLYTLAERAQKEYGVQIFEQTQAEKILSDNTVSVTTAKGKVTAQQCVITTYTPFTNPLEVQTKLLPFESYVIQAEVPHKILEEAIYWDTADPYNYFRIDSIEGHDSLILGGRDHKTGQMDKKRNYFAELEQYFATLVPKAPLKIMHRWSGEIIDTIDGVPYIGRLPSSHGQFVATGFAGNGMTYSTVAAKLITDIILGQHNAWIDVYDPKRFSGIGEFIKQNIDYPVQLVKDLFTKDKSLKEEQISKGEGKIVEVNGKKIAVYKDEGGTVTKLSAICTHMGCTVSFNSAEKTWDCPCHGSRFSRSGKVIIGPAQKPLEKVE